jgi:hypothetical protein
VRESLPGNAVSTGAAAGAAPARDLSPDEEKTTLNLFKIFNEKIKDHVNPTISYQEAEMTVRSLHWNGFHCRDEKGASVIVPFEWQYLKELVGELVLGGIPARGGGGSPIDSRRPLSLWLTRCAARG